MIIIFLIDFNRNIEIRSEKINYDINDGVINITDNGAFKVMSLSSFGKPIYEKELKKKIIKS